jgi:hypothetical protein
MSKKAYLIESQKAKKCSKFRFNLSYYFLIYGILILRKLSEYLNFGDFFLLDFNFFLIF